MSLVSKDVESYDGSSSSFVVNLPRILESRLKMLNILFRMLMLAPCLTANLDSSQFHRDFTRNLLGMIAELGAEDDLLSTDTSLPARVSDRFMPSVTLKPYNRV